MDSSRDSNNRRNNTMYYNQMVRDSRVPQSKESKKHGVGSKSFGSQDVDLSTVMFAPEGWESIFYTVYFFTIPYVVGAVFLFLFIAGATFENFMLLEMSSFFIVWAIGYEVIAALSLTYIAYLYMTYLSDDNRKKARKAHY